MPQARTASSTLRGAEHVGLVGADGILIGGAHQRLRGQVKDNFGLMICSIASCRCVEIAEVADDGGHIASDVG